jgi:hypothetical protein
MTAVIPRRVSEVGCKLDGALGLHECRVQPLLTRLQ